MKDVCKPLMQVNDGIFWMDKEEFFQYFSTIYLCAHDMSVWLQPAAGSDATAYTQR